MHILAQILTICTQFACTNQACKLCYLIRSSDFHWVVGVWVSQLGRGQNHWMPTWRRGMQETRKGKRQLLIDGTNLTKTNLPLNLTMPKKSSYKQSHLASAWVQSPVNFSLSCWMQMTLFSIDLLFHMRKINAKAKNQAFGFGNQPTRYTWWRGCEILMGRCRLSKDKQAGEKMEDQGSNSWHCKYCLMMSLFATSHLTSARLQE